MARRDYGRDRYGWKWRGPKRALQKQTESSEISPGQLDEFIADLREAAADIDEPVVAIRDYPDGIVVTGWKFATKAQIAEAEREWERLQYVKGLAQTEAVTKATETLARLAPERLSDDAR